MAVADPPQPPRKAKTLAHGEVDGKTLIIRGHANSFTGYGQHTAALGKEVERLGCRTWFDRIDLDEAQLPLDSWIGNRLLAEPYEGPKFLSSPPDRRLDSNTVTLTMWETTRLRDSHVANLNQAKAVLVPCHWCLDVFKNSGVTVPIRVVPLGYDPTVYFPMKKRPGPVKFGASARTCHGGLRKGFDDVVAAFRLAFPRGDEKVILELKTWPDCPASADFDDPRIKLIKEAWTDEQLADWYRTLTAFVSMSKGEGFGLQPLQAMACGIPAILPLYGGHAEYADKRTCYPVVFEEIDVPADLPIYGGLGKWCIPSVASCAAAMVRVFDDPGVAGRKGALAAVEAKRWTWQEAGVKLVSALQEFGLLEVERPRPMPSVAQLGTNFVKAVVRHAADGFQQASPGVQEERMRICRACPRFEATSERCSHPVCGCWCARKTAWLSEKCPEGRWS